MYFLFLGVIGLLIGSFLGAFTFRYPRGKSVIRGRSYCVRCGSKIRWYDNIPLISYFILGAKCRDCGARISLRYPLIELATALGFIWIGILAPQSWWHFLYLLFVFPILLAIFVIDLEHRVIPDSLAFFLLTLAIFYLLFGTSSDFYTRIFSGFIAALFLLLIHLITKGRGMGLGDVKFALFGGVFLGLPVALVWLFWSFLTGAFVGIILILVGKASFGKEIAFGPFLVFSLTISYLWGDLFIIKMFF